MVASLMLDFCRFFIVMTLVAAQAVRPGLSWLRQADKVIGRALAPQIWGVA